MPHAGMDMHVHVHMHSPACTHMHMHIRTHMDVHVCWLQVVLVGHISTQVSQQTLDDMSEGTTKKKKAAV